MSWSGFDASGDGGAGGRGFPFLWHQRTIGHGHDVVEIEHRPLPSSNGMGPEFYGMVRGFRGVVERLCGVVREFYGMVFDLTAWC